MRSILEEFACDNISLENETFRHNSKYGQAIRTVYSGAVHCRLGLSEQPKR